MKHFILIIEGNNLIKTPWQPVPHPLPIAPNSSDAL